MRVLLLEPAPRDHHWFHLTIRTPHLGPPILAAALKREGHVVEVHSEFVAPVDLAEAGRFDVVGISANTTLTHQRAYAWAGELRHRFPRLPLIAGGHHVTLNPGEALAHFDYVVRGYAEVALPSLVAELAAGVRRIRTPGVTWSDPEQGARLDNPAGPPVAMDVLPDLSSIRGYADHQHRHHHSVRRYTDCLPLSFHSRGCNYACDFCSIPGADEQHIRYRDPGLVVEDLRAQLAFYRFPYRRPKVWLIDDNFGASPRHTTALLDALVEARLPCEFVVQCRVEIARQPALLALMRRAGFSNIYLGIESIDDETLRGLGKRSSRDHIAGATTAIRSAGLGVVALLIIGADGDRPGLAGRLDRWLRTSGVDTVCPQILVPIPGTPAGERIVRGHRRFLADYRWTNQLPVHFPATLRPSQVVREIVALARAFHRRRDAARALFAQGEVQTLLARRALVQGGALRRTEANFESLRALEAPYYDGHDKLDLDRLHRDAASGALADRAETFRRALGVLKHEEVLRATP